MEKIKIGQIVNVVALKGEVKVYNYSDYKERFEELEYIYIEKTKTKIEKVRYMKEMVILKLEGVEDRSKAEALKGKNIFIGVDQLRELPEDTFYIKDLIGLDIKNQDDQVVGKLKDVIQNSAQDLYEIELDNKKTTLIPGVAEFILDINIKDKYIKIKFIDGILDL
ncbi:MAG: ribosome maturation factor RimM [Aminipila sp.]